MLSLESTLRRALGLVVLLAQFAVLPLARAEDETICIPKGYTIGFFNGVWNTPLDATQGLAALRSLMGDTAFDDEPIRYELFYNQTDGKLQDVAETFVQRANEYDASGDLGSRFEYYWAAVHGNDSVWDDLTDAGELATSAASSLFTSIEVEVLGLLGSKIENPSQIDHAEHRTRLEALALERQKLVLVAHSQGNLYVTQAYDYVSPKVGASSVGVVHIAPASPTLRGDYILADIDVVINGLRNLGTHASVPPSNFTLQLSRSDASGHTLTGTYLDASRPAAGRIQLMIGQVMRELETPETEGSIGAFTVTLTWNGAGDVDLHTFEPGGSHVFYRNKKGVAGFLDIDNTSGYGPEHYYASCEPQDLQLGTYSVGINNYREATGRTATVQVASSTTGVLATRSLDVGPEREADGNQSPIPVFNVKIGKDSEGRYEISVH